jgi:hypothetical protein
MLSLGAGALKALDGKRVESGFDLSEALLGSVNEF